MGALSSLSPAVSGLLRNPILLVITGLYGLFQLPQIGLQAVDPLLASAVSLLLTGVIILVLPFFQGGIIAMAGESISGRTSFDTLIREGKANYLTLLLAYFILLAVNMVLGVFVLFGIIFGGFALFAEVRVSFAVMAVVVVIALLVVLVYLLLYFFVQFYAHAIVLSDADLVGGFKQSVGLVRRNLLSTLGYTVIMVFGGSIVGVIATIPAFAAGPEQPGMPLPELSTPLVAVALLVYVLGIAVLGAFYATYSVAFYREISSTPRV